MSLARFPFLVLLLATSIAAQAIAGQVAVPALEGRVTDLAGVLSSGQRQQLEETLRQFEASKGSQVVVLVVPTTGEETIEQYGIRVADQWKIGRRGVDDGVILLVAKNDRTLRIEVGRGLEGAIPDAVASRIINEVIVPYFKNGDVPGGIRAGVDRIVKTIQGEPLPAPRASGTAEEAPPAGSLVAVLFIVGTILMSSVSAVIGRLLGGMIGGGVIGGGSYFLLGDVLYAAVLGVIAFVAIVVVSSAQRSGRRSGRMSRGGGHWGSGGGRWSGGSGGGFSGGGGGFSGGGGGFSGGGASGRW